MPANIIRPRKGLWFGALLALALLLSACQSTAKDLGGFSLNSAYTLTAGETRSGDQVVVAQDITLEPDSSVAGDITLMGSQVTVRGQVDGDVIVVADRFVLGDEADISGNLVVCAKEFQRGAAAQVGGTIKEECARSSRVSVAKAVDSGWSNWRSSFWFRLGTAVAGALFFGALSALLTAIFPRPLGRMAASIYRAPALAGGVGCLTILLALGVSAVYGLSLLLVLPVVLLPIVLLGWLALGLLAMLGWVALAQPTGVYVLQRLGLERQPPMLTAGVGGVVLALLLRVWGIFWFTAWIGLIVGAALASVGLGAVILTRAGSRPYAPRESPTGG
jgi:hypothetical protein